MSKFLNKWKKTGGRNYFFWLRITQSEVDNLLKGNANLLVEADLRRKYLPGYEFQTCGPAVYVYKRDEDGKIIKSTKKLLCYVLSLQGYMQTKSMGYYDKDWLKNNPDCHYNICLDEAIITYGQEGSGMKRMFNVKEAFLGVLENICRISINKSINSRVKIICICNNIGTAAEVLSATRINNFIPREFGIKWFKKYRILILNIAPDDSIKYMYDNSVAGVSFNIDSDKNFTNEDMFLDESLIISAKERKSKLKPLTIVKFDRDPMRWFVIHEKSVIKRYNGENLRSSVAMRMYIDERFNKDQVNNIIDLFNNRCFRYKDLITFLTFQSELQRVKAK